MIMPGLDDDAIRSTGGQVDDLAMAMIDAAYDKESDCRDQICDALFDLGKRRPGLVLSSCYSYLKKHNKLQTGHRVVLLQCMERIIKETINDLDAPLAVDVIKQCAMELTNSKEVMPEWQTSASGVLVALGARFCDEVMDEMLQRFQPGVLPHFFVVQTIGNLATSNVYGMVPHLTAVLGTMLPMLGMAKHENMRWVFSSALSKFSEAIIDYCANTDKAPDPSVSKNRFEQEIGSAFDILFNSWLQITKEMKLRVAIVEAIGNMCHLMARDKLEEQLPKILQVILGLYKKHPEPIHVTQGLCSVLDAVCLEGNTVLEPHLDTVLNFLFPQVINPPDYKNPQSIKNQNEVLRCLAIIARSFSGKLTGILLSKLESGNEKMKIGMLTVFKHLINAATDAMEDKQEVVVSGLKMMLSEQSNKLKKVFAQVVIAMAHHGYLELEGGQQMIEFIVKQCALKDEPPGKRSPDPEYVKNQALRTMCDHVLQLLTTTVEDIENVLWPYLLELVVPEQYTDAQGVVCKCLAHLATKKRKEQAEDYEIDYETQANIPKPPAMIARLMVLAGRPQNGRNRGIHVLTLMQGLAPNLNDQLVELWDTVIPKLIQYLEDASKEDTWNQKNWEDLSLKLLSKSLDVVDNEEWIAELGELFGQQIPMYNNYPEEKNFLYKCLGVITRKSTKKDFVSKQLDLIFGTVKHSDQTEREGCAIAMGFCAASHLDAVLSKLESVAKTDLQQKSSGLFSFMKGEKSEVDVERTKATLMLCYGFVALFSPISLIVSRMEATILRSIQPYFANVKDALNLDLRRCLIRTIELIGKAFDPRIMKKSHSFIPKQKFLSALKTYMQMESTTSLSNETRALAMNACTTLVKLDPRLSEAEELDLIRTSIDCIYPLPPGGLSMKKNKEDSYEKTLEIEVLMQATFDALHDLLKEMLLKDLTPNGLNSIFKQLSKWFLSLEEHERERSLTTLLIVEQFLLENIEPSSGGITDFPTECVILAKLVPRCTDPSIKVRQLAMDCVQCTLKIAAKITGNSLDQPDQMIDALTTLKDRLEKEDSNVLFSVINDLAKVIAKKLPSGQLVEFLDNLQEGLLDPQSHSSSGACVVLNGILKARGNEVSKQVSAIIKYLHDKLEQIEFDQTRTGTLRSVRTLASHHLSSVVKALLSYPLPFDSNIVALWEILCQDAGLTSGMIDQMLDMLLRQLPYEEKTDGDRITKTSTQQTLAVTCAFKILLDVEETEEVVMKNYHRLFSALLIRIGCSLDCKAPKQTVQEEKEKPKEKKKNAPPPPSSKVPLPSRAAVDSFRAFLKRSKSDDIIEGLEKEDCWDMLEEEDRFPESVTILCSKLVESEVGKPYISKIVSSLMSGLSSLYDPQRITVAAFYSELINLKCAGNDDMIEMVMNSLLGRLVDSSHMVRMLCIRGLGNVASNEKAQVQQYSTTVLSAMMAGMDDKEDPEDLITTEAMSGLSKILSEIDESHIRAILINVSLRIRPCFEKDRSLVRAQAFILFGNLSRFGDGPSKAPFLEQIHSNFVSLLLHLNDPDSEVKKACKFSLRLLGPLLDSEAINNKFQKYLLEDANLIYGEFMNDLAKCIIQDFPDKVNFYVMGCLSFYKSMWSEIKCNAALFTGYLLGNLSEDKQTSISKEHVCSALIILLKDPASTVRSAAAEAMSLLYEY